MKSYFLLVFFFFSILQGFTQTGPGGVGNSTNNGLWLKANDFTQNNNTAVSTWVDASGNGNNAVQVTANKQPLFFNTSNLNAMPIVRLDGSNDEMQVGDAAILDGTSGITYYTVLRPNNLNNQPRGIIGKRISYNVSADYSYTWFFHTSNRLFLDINDAGQRFNTAGAFSNATNYMLSFDFDGTLASGSRSGIRSTSVDLIRATESSTTITNSNIALTIGALNTNYSNYLGADYAELIQYNYALNQVERIIVENYLSAKYNISLASNNYYDQDNSGNGNYDFDVAGIGRLSASLIHNNSQGSGIVGISSPNNLGDNEFLFWGHNNEALSSFNETDLPATIEGRLQRDWSVTETGEVGTVTLTIDLSMVFGSKDANDLRLLIDADGIYSAGATLLGPPTLLSGNTFEWTGVDLNNNDHFTIGSLDTNQTPLPIMLEFFKGNVTTDKAKVLLDWKTSAEINNAGFYIEKSNDGKNFKTLEFLDGLGTSSVGKTYRYFDSYNQNEVAYRLKQVDFNGQFTYSKIIFLDEESQNIKTPFQFYPNPTSGAITLLPKTNQVYNVQIIESSGRHFLELEIKTLDEIELSLNHFISKTSNGTKTFYVRFFNEYETFTLPLFLMNK